MAVAVHSDCMSHGSTIWVGFWHATVVRVVRRATSSPAGQCPTTCVGVWQGRAGIGAGRRHGMTRVCGDVMGDGTTRLRYLHAGESLYVGETLHGEWAARVGADRSDRGERVGRA